jgi:hypothetical protein
MGLLFLVESATASSLAAALEADRMSSCSGTGLDVSLSFREIYLVKAVSSKGGARKSMTLKDRQ